MKWNLHFFLFRIKKYTSYDLNWIQLHNYAIIIKIELSKEVLVSVEANYTVIASVTAILNKIITVPDIYLYLTRIFILLPLPAFETKKWHTRRTRSFKMMVPGEDIQVVLNPKIHQINLQNA